MIDYIIGHMINYERGFVDYYIRKSWDTSRNFPANTNYRRTDELTVLVLGGSGSIGSYVCSRLAQFGLRVLAYGRRQRSLEEIEEFSKKFGIQKYSNQMEDLLPEVDYIICILPATLETDDLLSNGVLAKCSRERRPVLINVGRGNVISEKAILEALDQGWIRYAILDVFRVEPLPPESPLWSRTDVHITPHSSATTRNTDVVRVFLNNWAKYLKQEPVECVIDFDAGY